MSLEGDRGLRCGLQALDINQVREYVNFGGINPPAPQLCVMGVRNDRSSSGVIRTTRSPRKYRILPRHPLIGAMHGTMKGKIVGVVKHVPITPRPTGLLGVSNVGDVVD